ncbi:MAG: TraR/DksA family transcriptional regulator [Rhodobacteraceae bacterium]|nr:TraR/DksA family transcriptional regulator [Paracoccaceae bacterium]
MNETELARFRERLKTDLKTLAQEDDLGREGQNTVTLDQQAVGRLSRMDALQGQAMANATKARRAQQRQRIMATFTRMDEGEFGYCLECGEEIAPKRLELDPTTPTCISCASGS